MTSERRLRCTSPAAIVIFMFTGVIRPAIHQRLCVVVVSDKLYVRACRTTPSRAIELEDTFKVGKEHCYLLSLALGGYVEAASFCTTIQSNSAAEPYAVSPTRR
jgi:hypothetical protein